MSGDACLGRGAAAPANVSAGSGSGAGEAARESGAARWASGAEVPESGAGVGSESGAALRGKRSDIYQNFA